MAPAGEPTAFCSECRIHYPNYMAYAAHRTRKMKAGEGHIHCEICGMDFTLRETLSRHHKQEHAREQDLDCPGCGLHFIRVGGLFSHFQNDECLKISKGVIENARLDRSTMGRNLAKLNEKDPKEYFGKFLASGSIPDETTSASGYHRSLLGHIESADPASSTLDSRGKAPEGSTLSVGVRSSQAQPICGPEPRPVSFDTAGFPTLAEAATCKNAFGKGKAAGASSLVSSAQNTKVQHASGPDFRPGSLDKAEFPALAEANAHKGNTQRKNHIVGVPSASISSRKTNEISSLSGVKTLGDSRWAPKKTAGASARQIQSRGMNEAVAAPFEPQQQTGPLLQASLQPSSEQAKSVPDQHQPESPRGFGPHAQEVPGEGIEQSETTSQFWGIGKGAQAPGDSLKTVPPHLRGKLLQAAPTDSSQVSTFSVDDEPVKMLPPHLQGELGAGLTTAYTEASKDENGTSTVNASTVKHSDQGTMGSPPANSRGSRASSALPPHLRGKLKGVVGTTDDGGSPENGSSNGGVPLEREKPGHADSSFAEVTKTQVSGAPSILTGQSTVGFCSELGSTQSSRSQEFIGTTHGNTSLPPHLRKEISGKPVAAPVASPAERSYSTTPSMSTGQSTPEPADAGVDSGVGQLGRPQDNFGVIQSVKSHATVTKSSEKLPPHLRGKQGANPMLSTSPCSVGTQTEDAPTGDVSEIRRNIVLRPTDTSVDAVSLMDPEEEGIVLGHHDPQHPLFDAREYLSPYSKRFQCPIPRCGKAFKSMQGITGHLASDVHRRPLAKYQCPHCLRNFASTAALTQHSESQGRRCEIRNTSEFRPFFDQLTAGIADVEGIHDDQTNRYIITKEAVEKYGDDELRGRMAVEQHENKQIEDKGGHYYDGKDIDW